MTVNKFGGYRNGRENLKKNTKIKYNIHNLFSINNITYGTVIDIIMYLFV